MLKNILKSKEMDVIFNKIIEVLEEENNTLIVPSSQEFREENIKSMIYEIRGKQVMFDFDLAILYECKNGTKEINQAVKNNIEKFPERFSWVLTDEEFLNLRSKLLTANLKSEAMKRFNPRVFTEEGIVMLATILKSHVAIQVSIAIMDTFVAMRKYISNDLIEQRYINNLVLEHDSSIKLLKESFLSFEEKKKASEIYFNGQIYDAYSKIVDLMKEAKKELIIIDNYADKQVLDMIRNISVKVKLVVRKNTLLKNMDILKYKEQYDNLEIIYDNTYHDRYLIIDKLKVYHLGTSINYIGSKTFSINTISDIDIINMLVNKVCNC